MPDLNTERDPIEVLADEFMARQRQGECPTIDEYAARHPQFAPEIRTLFPTIAALEKLKTRQQRTPDGRVSLGGCRLERLGDFRILGEIGRGGMGIVYLAEQESLGRLVAVKVLPRQSLTDPRHLQRFQREARTAAGLHHGNIVPVFGVGQEEGFHFYVMQYIHGVGLDRVLARLEHCPRLTGGDELMRVARDLLDEQQAGKSPSDAKTWPRESSREAVSESTRPLQRQRTVLEVLPGPVAGRPPRVRSADAAGGTYWRAVARAGLQIADALHYAHRQGTLHRDIKPANLIVDPQGLVWVADFGLAKALEHDAVTRSGDVIGTLAYLAPEQLQGQADCRSDIYSLGLTLYELLTLQPAFQDTNRMRLLQRIARDVPPRPRQVRPEIPRDLETIVLKAAAHEPERRYASAADLARDLRCFLEDRPIRARRVSSAERLWRWCRRNPVIAGLTATATALLLLVAATASIGYARTSRALAGERIQRERAEAATDVAIQVLDRIYERFAPPQFDMPADRSDTADGDLASKPILSEGAAAALEDLLVFYDRLAESGEQDGQYREKVALANRRVGDIRHRLAQFDQAAEAYERALQIYLQIDHVSEGNPHLLQIASIYKELGVMAHRLGEPETARRRLEQALETLHAASAAGNDTSELRLQIMRVQQLLQRIADFEPLWPRPPGPGPGMPPRGPYRPQFGPPADTPRRPGSNDAARPPLGPPRKPRPGPGQAQTYRIQFWSGGRSSRQLCLAPAKIEFCTSEP